MFLRESAESASYLSNNENKIVGALLVDMLVNIRLIESIDDLIDLHDSKFY